MRVRRSIFPRSLQDAVITSFLIIIIPLIYYFEIFIVLPHFYELWSPVFVFHLCTGTFILWNLCSNMIAIILCDTSINGLILHTESSDDWKFCSVCESIAPPRSWHCEICNMCILKRDHHCKFTSCCIGYFNHRFFYIFVLYMFIATVYASVYNFCFIYETVHFDTLGSLLKVIFPMASLFVYFTYKEIYLAATLLTVFGAMFTGVLLVFHSKLILKNKTTHERQYSKYDRGRLENIKEVFGEKWFLVWLSPFVVSKLPQDGVHWVTQETRKVK